MKKIFIPKASYTCAENIEFDLLKKLGIINLCFDLDNTLGLYDQALPSKEKIKLVNNLKKMGFNVFVISNNNKERVGIFSNPLNCMYLSNARKPGTKRMDLFFKEKNIDKNTVAMIGDQVMTDVLVANKLGVFSILLKPISKNELLRTKFNRKIESIVKLILGINYNKKIDL